VTIAVASHFILGFPFMWGLLLGLMRITLLTRADLLLSDDKIILFWIAYSVRFVLGAVSPAVVVPSLLHLSGLGYGLDKGIPTIVIAASSLDDILAISAFGIVLGFIFAQEQISLVSQLVHGPSEILMGIGFGLVWGSLCGIFAAKRHIKKEVGFCGVKMN
jgi:NhaP-type Na+/H+ or K+/H+ antiporter